MQRRSSLNLGPFKKAPLMERITLISLILNTQTRAPFTPLCNPHLFPTKKGERERKKKSNLVLFVICILPGTKSRMTSPGYKKGKRFRWIILRAALWVGISKQARVEGGKFQGWVLRAHAQPLTHTSMHRHTRTLCPQAALGERSALFSPIPF